MKDRILLSRSKQRFLFFPPLTFAVKPLTSRTRWRPCSCLASSGTWQAAAAAAASDGGGVVGGLDSHRQHQIKEGSGDEGRRPSARLGGAAGRQPAVRHRDSFLKESVETRLPCVGCFTVT